MPNKINFNADWKFFLGDDATYSAPQFDTSSWKPLTLPHDWGCDYALDEKAPTGGGGGYAVTGIGWYRKNFIIEKRQKEKRISILFGGIFMDSTIYINGKKVGGRAYGYSEFTVDITDAIVAGDNVIAVRVNNSLQPNSRWYTGSGIYRDCYLLESSNVHIEINGVFCLTNHLMYNNTKARLQIQTTVRNDGNVPDDVGVYHSVIDVRGKVVVKDAGALHIEAESSALGMVAPVVDNPKLWSVESPYLYTLKTTLIQTQNGEIIDEVQTKIGIRSLEFDADNGFILNGERIKIKGMCVHHDGGVTGAAFFRETWERRLYLLKDMGCNGIRMAHNPPDSQLLDLCDEMGFLVMDEAFDEWLLTKYKSAEYGYSSDFAFGYGSLFSENADRDLVSMLRRDRNHPSVILWSIGNEIPDQAVLGGKPLLERLQTICHTLDPTRLVTSALDNVASPDEYRTRPEFECALDVAGYNYVARWGKRAETLYDEDRAQYPKRRFIGSENPSAGGIRGEYKIDRNTPWRMNYDEATHNHEFLWRYTASRDFIAGDYLWTGIDYLGETRWPWRGAPFGPIDTAGFPKDTFYYFRSIWNDRDITLHILPHWNSSGKKAGEFLSVIAYTNCDEVTLSLNGKVIGTKGYDFPNVGMKGAWNIPERLTHPTTHDLHLQWDVPYESGELKAVGFRDGKKCAEVILKTTGSALKLSAKIAGTQTKIPIGGIAQIEIAALDAEGVIVPDASPEVTIKVNGSAAELLGLDSGDIRDLTPFNSRQRKMCAGLLLAVVRGGSAGKAMVNISAKGLEGVEVSVSVSVE
ncbi:hypothetical protein FACS1894172_05670 [Spirochaetia bacterium]|nr:hypothetical protein FACS1894164_00570 [Spirochaetia bacterium]GHU31189.1 hypothetical protein FACS1894172_05670 [Spirochaetia bacterium]